MVQTYKNFLIVARSEKGSPSIVSRVKQLGYWFENDIWHVKNGGDCIFLIYKHPIDSSNKVCSYNGNIDKLEENTIVGYIHVYCCGPSLKIKTCKIEEKPFFYIKMFKNYILSWFKSKNITSEKIDKCKCRLYWDRDVLSNYRDTILFLGLLTNDDHHLFTKEDLIPVQINMNEWGLI